MKKPKTLKFINFKTKFRQQQTGKCSDSVLVLHEKERKNRRKKQYSDDSSKKTFQ
jgi:hypothetical protein